MAKPCERSSRCMRFRCPPDLGVWAHEGVASATTAARPSEIAAAKVRERLIVLLSLRRPSGRMVFATGAGETLAKYRAWEGLSHRFRPPKASRDALSTSVRWARRPLP